MPDLLDRQTRVPCPIRGLVPLRVGEVLSLQERTSDAPYALFVYALCVFVYVFVYVFGSLRVQFFLCTLPLARIKRKEKRYLSSRALLKHRTGPSYQNQSQHVSNTIGM